MQARRFAPVLGVLLSVVTSPGTASGRKWDLSSLADSVSALENPDKGWYHHYYDNGTWGYLLKADADLDSFPGMNHLYIRLAWAYFEPEEGRFDWRRIDDLVRKWEPKGYRFSVTVSCKETGGAESTPGGSGYATPKWVQDAGAKGTWVTNWNNRNWEPDWGDPVFLSKLERFHRVFAARYDGAPWLVDVDLGSYGDWGEGHTGFSTNTVPPVSVIKAHMDLHGQCYKRTQVAVGDDWLKWNRTPSEERELFDHARALGFSVRDNSVLVKWWLEVRPATFSIDRPEYFRAVFPEKPVTIEMEHYRAVLENGNWKGQDGSVRGADFLRGAVAVTHPTYIGYHGYADQWLKDNPKLTRELLNKMGYWYFPVSADMPDTLRTGETSPVVLRWENRGVAPAYQRYRMQLSLEGESDFHTQWLLESDNRRWLPDRVTAETCAVYVPSRLPAGEYTVKVRMHKDTEEPERLVRLAVRASAVDGDGFCEIGHGRVAGVSDNRPPLAEVSGLPKSGAAPLDVRLDASGSSDPDGDPLTVYWDFGDGASVEGPVCTHTFRSPNLYRVLLRVLDSRGGMAEKALRIQVKFQPGDVGLLPSPPPTPVRMKSP